MPHKKKLAVIAIGGNSLIKDDKHVTVDSQYQAAKETCMHIADMIEAGWDVANEALQVMGGLGYSQEAIVARLNRNGADSILMVRVTRLRIEEVNSTPYVAARSTWNSYYESRYEYVYTPPMTTEFEVATIEANLYDAKTGTLIWLANLETVIGGDLEKVFGDFARTVTRDLQKQGLL